MGEEKGSVMSGDRSEEFIKKVLSVYEGAVSNRGRERSRIASVIDGWKRPPKGECARR